MASLTKYLCTFSRRTVRFLFALVAAWLFVSCLVTTSYVVFVSDDLMHSEMNWICPDSTWLQCLLFSLVCLIWIFLFNRCSPSANERRLRTVRLALIYFAGLLASLWVVCIQLTPRADACSIQTAAADLYNGHTYLFAPGEYMYVYPHQSGLLLIHLLLQQINPNTTLPFQLLNVLCYMGILYSLGEFGLEFGLGEGGSLSVTALGIAFLPLLFYVSFVYGTIPGLFLSMAGLLLTIHFCRNAKWYQAVSASVLLSMAVLFKSNYQIFVIAALLYALYNGLQGKKHCFWLPMGLLLGWLLAGKLPILILERWTGCSLHNGISTAAWLAMGLRDDILRGPGWYSEYTLGTYFTAGMDPQAQNVIVLDSISGTLQGWLMHPKAMVSFFARKNATQWSEPLFQSLWLNLVGHTAAYSPLPKWTEFLLNSQGPNFLNQAMNLLQTLVYGGLVLWAWVPTSKIRKPSEDLLALVLLGGFVFHTFWEAKSQYTLPYFVLILPLAILGYRRLAALPWEPNRQALWHSIIGKIRFLVPILLMITAALLSLILAPALHDTLAQLLQAFPQ